MKPFPEKIDKTREAIRATLAYFDLFGIALTEEELEKHLLAWASPKKELKAELKAFFKTDNYYHLKEFDFKAFQLKQKRTKEYWAYVKRWTWALKLCPFIHSIYVCNSLPIGDVDEKSDIDLFVITKSKQFFTARLILTCITHLLGLRRHGTKVRKRFCLSFFISEEVMNLEKILLEPYDIYFAYWFKTLTPIVGIKRHKELIQANPWVKKYFPHLDVSEASCTPRIRKEGWLENKLKHWQLKRAQEKKRSLKDSSGTILSETMLKFHDHDAREGLRSRWEGRLKTSLMEVPAKPN